LNIESNRKLKENLIKDGNGYLDKEEFRLGIKLIYREIDLNVTDKDIERMIQMVSISFYFINSIKKSF